MGPHWPLEQQYQDIENALYHTVQKSDESHDSFLARADVLWSKALSRKLSLSDLQAFATLRGSLLSPDEKKRVILDADQSLEGKLTVPRVREAIRVLGATFFASMTGQKVHNKTKVYDAATLHVETLEDPTMADGLVAADENGNEDDFIEALMQEGEDEDAVLVADFEALAADTIQEDSELAQAFNAYSDARRRLSEKFRNRGFWPTSKSSHQKGKGYGGKSFGHRGKGGFQQQRPKKSLQDRIMQSNCRACGRKGHWKAECPYKSASQAASTTSGGTSVPTSTAIVDDDALPLEFVHVPFLKPEVSCPIPEEPNECCDLGESCFFLYGVNDNSNTARLRLKDSLQHYRDRIHSESGVCNVNESFQDTRERMRQWNRRSDAKFNTGESVRPSDFRPSSNPVANCSNKSEHDSIGRQEASVCWTLEPRRQS